MSNPAPRLLSLVNRRITYRMVFILVLGNSLIGLLVLLILIVVAGRIQENEMKTARQKATTLTAGLAIESLNGVYVGQPHLLEEAAQTLGDDPDLVYVVFYSKKERALYSRFGAGAALEDFKFPELRPNPEPALEEIQSSAGPYVLDASAPVVSEALAGGTAGGAAEGANREAAIFGWVRLGLATDQIHQSKNSVINVWYYVMALLVILGGVIIELLNRGIARPIKLMALGARRIGQGELDLRMDESSQDELGDLARAFNEMAQNVKSMVARADLIRGRIGETVAHILHSTEEMFGISAEQSSGATEQAASVYQASSTSKEIAASANRIAETAQEVTTYANNSQATVERGRDELAGAVRQVEDLTHKTEETARRTVELGEKSQKISGIIDIINEISEQTNLLALNAAIEAAGAGEAGRRFSVVAHEIRRLATRTLEATRVVRDLVEEIQTSTNLTVMVTEQSMKGARESQDTITNLNSTFQNILDLVEQTLTASTEINLSTRQQTTACEQMVSTIMEVSDVAAEVEKGAKESEKALRRLRELSATLKQLATEESF